MAGDAFAAELDRLRSIFAPLDDDDSRHIVTLLDKVAGLAPSGTLANPADLLDLFQAAISIGIHVAARDLQPAIEEHLRMVVVYQVAAEGLEKAHAARKISAAAEREAKRAETDAAFVKFRGDISKVAKHLGITAHQVRRRLRRQVAFECSDAIAIRVRGPDWQSRPFLLRAALHLPFGITIIRSTSIAFYKRMTRQAKAQRENL